ncbi:hypothetical protein EXIGLDRAFT_756657 [Exidia glandulosa HHB12029]|uniref:Fungal-type protein kinase domain-containing protein n=1 Tax=Exidia glandulosa HHB12029 TaxID=1314781 RepID=A0A165B5P1_EXIGL|nr:hypothetical protein EXIGLDRAFT_756657 [Exidia glandulosa HHB12029]
MAFVHPTPMRNQSAGVAEGRHQHDLKALMQAELCDLVFETPDVCSIFFPQNPQLHARVPRYSSKDTKKLLDSLVLDRSERASSERASYEPLLALLNYIVGHQQPDARVRFRLYDKVVAGKYDGAGALKPDLLGTEEAEETSDMVPWHDVWIAVEVKKNVPDGLAQAMTYARSMLEVGNKWFSVVVYYNHIERHVRLGFATRHGVFLSPVWRIVTQSRDYAVFASSLAHICHATEQSWSLDPFRIFDQNGGFQFNVPGLGSYRVERELSHRIHVVGRATHVYLASRGITASDSSRGRDSSPSDAETALNEKLATPIPRRVLTQRPTTRATAAARGPHAARDSAAALPLPASQVSPTVRSSMSTSPQTLANPSPANSTADWSSLCSESKVIILKPNAPLPALVIKDAWVIYERLQIEVAVLEQISGQFGCPELAGYATVAHPGMERLDRFLDSGAQSSAEWRCRFWDEVYSSVTSVPIFSPRVHRLIFYKTIGVSLELIAKNPAAVIHAMKDCVIALYILLLAGYLHRDVAVGNILALLKPKTWDLKDIVESAWYRSDKRFENYKELFVSQYAFVCDFDQAVKWDADREQASMRSGTLAFMSTDRLSAWSFEIPGQDTLIDDLEGCIWVLFFVVLKAHEGSLSAMEKKHLKSFEIDDPYDMLGPKLVMLITPPKSAHLHNALRPTWPLWHRLFAVASTARRKLTTFREEFPSGQPLSPAALQHLKVLYTDTVFAYLDAVKEALEEIATAPANTADVEAADPFNADS